MKRSLTILATGVSAALALVLVIGASASAQTTTPAAPIAKAPQATAMPGHHMESPAGTADHTAMKADCQTMMAKRKEMDDKLQAMDASLDKLVVAMNAASSSKEPDAMEKPMAAVINELVAQRRTARAMMMGMQGDMMAHMMAHKDMHAGGMECPMMKGSAAGPNSEAKPRM